MYCTLKGGGRLRDSNKSHLPEGFVYLTDIVEDAILEIRYYSTYNFVGTRVDGYLAPVAIVTREAAVALKQASDELSKKGYVVKVFDTYRPQVAIDHFMKWAADIDDEAMKQYFYPAIDKDKLIPDGYIAPKSGHSRGSTIDLTLVDKLSGKELDMGSPFDFFGLESHHGTELISDEQTANRGILKYAMLNAGFKLYEPEWWHYSLEEEPFPDTYFEFLLK